MSIKSNNIFFPIFLLLILSSTINSKIPEDISDLLGGHILKVGTTGDIRPFSYLDKESNEYMGIDVELCKKFVEQHYVDVEFIPTTRASLINDLKLGKFHMAMCGIPITHDLKEQGVITSQSYIRSGRTLLMRKEDAEKFKDFEDANKQGLRVMVTEGGVSEKFAKEFLSNTEIVISESNENIPKKIANGECDIMVTDVYEGIYYSNEYENLEVPFPEQPFTDENYVALFPEDNEALKDWFDCLVEGAGMDGTVDDLVNEFLQSDK